uniref:Uncharacterized protein n=1 Tax=Arundo donax TaxID=35708 RepID=A0A0A8YKG6_ARUDO
MMPHWPIVRGSAKRWQIFTLPIIRLANLQMPLLTGTYQSNKTSLLIAQNLSSYKC